MLFHEELAIFLVLFDNFVLETLVFFPLDVKHSHFIRGPLLKEGNSVAMLSKEMLCYDWSKQQHSVSEQIKTQHLF